MKAWQTIGVLLGLGTVAALLSGGGGSKAPPPFSGKWVYPGAPQRIRALARPLEIVCSWPGLGDFLVAVAYSESRGNPRAGCGPNNEACGWFQLRPASAALDELGMSWEALTDESDAVAFAADYAQRLRKYAAPGQVITWLALRRGWALPGKLDDPTFNGTDGGLHARFVRGLAAAGLSPDFMHRPAFGPGFSWPGVHAALVLTAAVENAA